MNEPNVKHPRTPRPTVHVSDYLCASDYLRRAAEQASEAGWLFNCGTASHNGVVSHPSYYDSNSLRGTVGIGMEVRDIVLPDNPHPMPNTDMHWVGRCRVIGLDLANNANQYEETLNTHVIPYVTSLSDERRANRAMIKTNCLPESKPRIIERGLPAVPDIALNINWAREHGREHSGKWVAVMSGKLLGSDESLATLRSRIAIPKGCYIAKMP